MIILGPQLVHDGDTGIVLEARVSPTLAESLTSPTYTWKFYTADPSVAASVYTFDGISDGVTFDDNKLIIDTANTSYIGYYQVIVEDGVHDYPSVVHYLKVRSTPAEGEGEGEGEEGEAPAGFEVSPRHGDFGYVPVTKSGDILFTVKNTGGAEFTGADTIVSGPFSFPFSNNAAYTLAPGASRRL